MLALYRSGRQAEALEAYRATRHSLVESFGIEPSAPLQALERAILTQDPSLELGAAPGAGARRRRARRTVAGRPGRRARRAGRARAGAARASRGSWPARASSRAHPQRSAPSTAGARTAAFTSDDQAGDLVRLATANAADLVLVDAPPDLDGAQLPGTARASCSSAHPRTWPCSSGDGSGAGRGVHVPFGGGEHDWAALELGAWIASATGAPLRLVGTRADPRSGRRDASRLLADASLAVQRVVEVDAAPLLADPDGLVEAVAEWRPRRGRDLAALAPRGDRRRPPRARPRRAAARCCSSTAARARACSPRARAAPVSPGR